jgi:hypothetical protein
MPQATEWQRIGNQIDAAMIFAGPDFVNVGYLASDQGCPAIKNDLARFWRRGMRFPMILGI